MHLFELYVRFSWDARWIFFRSDRARLTVSPFSVFMLHLEFTCSCIFTIKIWKWYWSSHTSANPKMLSYSFKLNTLLSISLAPYLLWSRLHNYVHKFVIQCQETSNPPSHRYSTKATVSLSECVRCLVQCFELRRECWNRATASAHRFTAQACHRNEWGQGSSWVLAEFKRYLTL